jgi:hypothetical protein
MTAERAFKLVAAYFARRRRRAEIERLMRLREAARTWN